MQRSNENSISVWWWGKRAVNSEGSGISAKTGAQYKGEPDQLKN